MAVVCLQCANGDQGQGEQRGSSKERGATSGAPLTACQGPVVACAHALGRHDPPQKCHAGQKLIWLRAGITSDASPALDLQ